MPRVDRVADRLADEVCADGEAVQVVAFEHLLDRAHVTVLCEGAVDLEMVAPAGELEPVETPLTGLARELLEWEVGPLAGEESDGARHCRTDTTTLGLNGQMATPAAVPAGRPTLQIRGTPYPVLLPTLRDPRLHLAAVIISLQVLGQVAFDFDLSIAQILISIGTCAVLEVAIAFRRQHVLMWPASALLTGNGVAFVLRVPGTVHGDWWSTNGWYIFAGTAAVSLLSKYVIKWRGNHVFNPSNFGLVLCFLILGKDRVEPLDFWWGPMSPWMALALVIIVAGGLAILLRLKLIGIAIAFWLTFAAGMAVIAGGGHDMTARWHLGPVTGRYFWWVLITSPEVLVFMFFMITDPKTTPKGRLARLVYGAGIGLLATLLIAPMRTEFAAKVALLGSLTIVCAARPLLEWLLPAAGSPDDRVSAWAGRLAARGRAGAARLGAVGLVGVAGFAGLVVLAGIPARPAGAAAPLAGHGPAAAGDDPALVRCLVTARPQDRADDRTQPRRRPARTRARALRTRNEKRGEPGLVLRLARRRADARQAAEDAADHRSHLPSRHDAREAPPGRRGRGSRSSSLP